MKKIIVLAAASALAFPAFAQTQTGVVNVQGTVGEKCIVTLAGTPTTGSFGGSVDLGQLDATDGRLKESAVLSSMFSAVAGTQLTYRVVCTTPSTQVAVKTDSLANGSATPSAGYANTVNYTAVVSLAMVGGDEAVSNDSQTAPGGTTQTFTKRLATGANNVTVGANTFRTPNNSDVLLAGTYNGKITITLTPAN